MGSDQRGCRQKGTVKMNIFNTILSYALVFLLTTVLMTLGTISYFMLTRTIVAIFALVINKEMVVGAIVLTFILALYHYSVKRRK